MASVFPCKDCVSGTIHTGKPLGEEVELCGLKVYVAPKPAEPKGVIVVFSDIFGWTLPNTRLLADAYAKNSEFIVYVPDYFPFQPIPLSYLDAYAPLSPESAPSFFDSFMQKAASMPSVLSFLVKARGGVTTPLIAKFLEALKATSPELPIFTVGFCFGGRFSLIAGTKKVAPGTVTAVAALHPSLMSIPSDIENTIVPVSIGVGTKDDLAPLSMIEKMKSIYGKQQVSLEVKIYENMIHGFAVRGDTSVEEVANAMADAKTQVLEWFSKHL
ncbi:dienelactone hydrolase [Limtongia smithiae]|uniref:dienelactone hydrolase n=1 Tax=Limtongia smithiae TaxID=1125753 RepID=UPI0034CDB829